MWDIDPTTVDAHRTTPYFWFKGNTADGLRFSYSQEYILQVHSVCLARLGSGYETGRLEWKEGALYPIPIEIRRNPRKRESYREFAAQWLPRFRRGCWLSGCPIEASAHEKAEWMQGFTTEELDAWNLKF